MCLVNLCFVIMPHIIFFAFEQSWATVFPLHILYFLSSGSRSWVTIIQSSISQSFHISAIKLNFQMVECIQITIFEKPTMSRDVNGTTLAYLNKTLGCILKWSFIFQMVRMYDSNFYLSIISEKIDLKIAI